MLSRIRNIFEPNDQRRAREFWTWFAANEKHYRDIGEDGVEERDHRIKVFLDHLKRYHPDLFLLVNKPEQTGDYELIITAEGMREVFPATRALVGTAPEIKAWKIIALKQPQPSLQVTKVGEKEFDATTIQFAQLKLPEGVPGLGISIFYSDYSEEQKQVFQLGSNLLLDSLLGEESATLHLAYVAIGEYPADLPADTLRPLTALPGLVALHVNK